MAKAQHPRRLVLGGFRALVADVNELPTADAGPDQVLDAAETCYTEVVLDGSRSFDPDGAISRFTWISPSGDRVQSAAASFVLPPGEHIFTLEVEDEPSGRRHGHSDGNDHRYHAAGDC